MRAPFTYFGGKSSAASLVWEALGTVQNYVEPFFGSGAVLLNRPRTTWWSAEKPGIETVNDKSAFLSNFWRAAQADPDGLARLTEWPVNEVDLHARHLWLVAQLPSLRGALLADPTYFDVQIASWWVWGTSAWIGQGWCLEEDGRAPTSQMPHLGNGGMGLNRASLPTFEARQEYLRELAARLRYVRVCSGDWSRVCSDAVTWRHGLTGVFLDPPYSEGNQQYAAGGTGTNLSQEVRAWAIEAGKRPDMRVVLAGYEGEHTLPDDWRCVPWKARSGYSGQRKEGVNDNNSRERLWMSPHCVQPAASVMDLFG